ncbi:MAG: cohesin domain-containing protein [Anaerolineae bacterium]
MTFVQYRSHLYAALAVALLFCALNVTGCGSIEQNVVNSPKVGGTSAAVSNAPYGSAVPPGAATATVGTGEVGAASLSQSGLGSAEQVHSSSIATLRLVRASDERALFVRVDDVHDLYAVDMVIRFDATRLQVADADAQTSGLQIKPGEAPRPDFVAVNSVDSARGIIRYVATQLGEDVAFSGSGTIATIYWETSITADADISVETVTLVNQHAQAIEVVIR